MPGYRRSYGKGGSYKKGKRKKKAQMGTGKVPYQGGGNVTMPNDVMDMISAQKGKQMRGAMKLFNALAKKLGKKVK
tara:strand:- start:1242 stop:1469 length:228 start_codon:yes stop_codon:yes gene_type:complete